MEIDERDYSQCVMYKLWYDEYVYYGFTTNIQRRQYSHKAKSKYSNSKIYQKMRETGGYDNWTFEIVEHYPCNDINEARLRERYWIENNLSNMNTNIPSRTYEQYVEDNREHITKRCREWRHKNPEKVKKSNDKYLEINREKINERSNERNKKKYREDEEYKKKVSESGKEIIECECGESYTKSHKKRHMNTKKHLEALGLEFTPIVCECGCELSSEEKLTNHLKTNKHINLMKIKI
jgi:hypothetical protein